MFYKFNLNKRCTNGVLTLTNSKKNTFNGLYMCTFKIYFSCSTNVSKNALLGTFMQNTFPENFSPDSETTKYARVAYAGISNAYRILTACYRWRAYWLPRRT